MRRLVLTLVCLLAIGGLQVPVAHAAAPLPPDRSRTGLTTIAPQRILDTRTSVGGHPGMATAGESVRVPVPFGASAKAVVVNLTVTGATSSGYATAYSDGSVDDSPVPPPGRSTTSTLNFTAGRAVANQAIVRVSPDGRISIYTSATAHLVVDVTGYYAETSEYGPYQPLNPTRVLDTRKGTGAEKRKVRAGEVVQLALAATLGTFNVGQRAVVLNVTATGATGPGYLTAYSGAGARPVASTLNYSSGKTVAAMTVVRSPDGVVRLYASATVDLVVDVTGYMPTAERASYESDYQPLNPARLLDTRSGLGGTTGQVASGGTVEVTVAGRGGVPGMGVTHPPVAVEVNLTAVSPTAGGYGTAYAAGATRPDASMLNYLSGETRANSATVQLSADGKLRLFTSARTHLIVDVVGYFVAPTPDPVVTTIALPGAKVGRAYDATLTAAGGVAPYTWSVSSLPDGLALDSTTGRISGSATTAGTSTVYVSVTDVDGVRSTSASRVLRVSPRTGDSATQVSAGAFHSCALLTSGGVQCWGSGSRGQLGNGRQASSTPSAVEGLDQGVRAIAAGDFFTCALVEDGTVECWGDNRAGQLGDGTTTDQPAPAKVVGLTGPVTSITAGGSHACAVIEDGTAECWGANSYGQLGDGSTAARSAPAPVPGLNEVASITAGAQHTCAVLAGGAADCWGRNVEGQIGDGTTTRRTTPTSVMGLESGVLRLAAGASHTCAVLDGGAAKCWGLSASLGSAAGAGVPSVPTPTAVTGRETGTASVAGGHGQHDCAVTVDGELSCWGTNFFGELGNGSTRTTRTPGAVIGIGGPVRSASTGLYHTCAVLLSGEVQCWGNNDSGQIGDGTQIDRLFPETVVGLEGSGS